MDDRRIGWSVIIAVALACHSACGGSDGGGGISTETAKSFEGVYRLDTATENPSACDVEGPSTLATITETQFVAIGVQVLTMGGLQLASCSDDADCASTATSVRAGSGWGAAWSWFLSESVGPDELAGLFATSGFLMNNVCTDRSYTAISVSRQGDALHIEARVTHLNDIPSDNGVCWADPAKERAEAAGLPCSSLQVMTGTKLGPLP